MIGTRIQAVAFFLVTLIVCIQSVPLLETDMRIVKDHPHSSSSHIKMKDNNNAIIGAKGRTLGATMNRFMDYFRNAGLFGGILSNMFDNSSGVKKEWVPLGSLIFNRQLSQS